MKKTIITLISVAALLVVYSLHESRGGIPIEYTTAKWTNYTIVWGQVTTNPGYFATNTPNGSMSATGNLNLKDLFLMTTMDPFPLQERYVPAELSHAFVTNWVEVPTFMTIADPEPAHWEHGLITENLVATIVRNGRTNCMIIDSYVKFPGVWRTYRLKTIRVYEP